MKVCQIHQTKHQVHQTKSIYAKQNTKYAKKIQNTPKNTKYAKKYTKYAKKTPTVPKKHQLRQKNTNYAKKTPNTQKTPNMQKNTKYSKKFHLRCFVAKKILFQIYALCWCTFYRPKKYGGVPKWTNMRYGYTTAVWYFMLWYCVV